MRSYLLVITVFTFISSQATVLRFTQPAANGHFDNAVIWSINKDADGLIWLSTSTHDILKYDGYQFEALKLPDNLKHKKMLFHRNGSNTLWVGSDTSALYTYRKHQFHPVKISSKTNKKPAPAYSINEIQSDEATNIWLATSNGLLALSDEGEEIYHLFEGRMVKDVLITAQQEIYAAVDNHLYQVFPAKNFQAVKLFSFAVDEMVRIIHKTKNNHVYIGTNKFLYEFTTTATKITGLPKNRILSMASNNNTLWVGTLVNGLYSIKLNGHTVTQFSYQKENGYNIAQDSVISLYLDSSGILFIGAFNGGLNVVNTAALNFGFNNNSINSIHCSGSNVIYSVFEDDFSNLWLSTKNGLIYYNNDTCYRYHSNDSANSISASIIFSVQEQQNNELWVSTEAGLNLLNKETKKVDRLAGHTFNAITYFSIDYNDEHILFGTQSAGLYLYNTQLHQSTPFPTTDKSLSSTAVYAYFTGRKNRMYFVTDLGIAYINENKELVLLHKINNIVGQASISDIYIDPITTDFWLSSDHGLFKISSDFRLLKHFKPGLNFPENTFLLDILDDDNNHLWISSFNGLYRLNKLNNDIHAFKASDGLQGNVFKRGSSFKSKQGKLYFGGVNGFNGFYPNDIKLDDTPPPVVITTFSRFNRNLTAEVTAEGFILEKPINELEKLTLSHKDYIFGFEFAALDFAEPTRNQYAYKMDGLDPEWNYVDASKRRVTYTNLNPGNYTFMVKASNKDGVWNEQPKQLQITVKPAPWFSWWAYVLYILASISVLSLYINRKTLAAQRMTDLLKRQVADQTKHIQSQKETVESLLTRKNELFSNVSHEFRTPLTLILGPIELLLKKARSAESIDALQIVKRNATRLLSLVEQLLQLAHVTENKKAVKKRVNVAATLKIIVASFKLVAQEKQLNLIISELVDTSILTTDSALEITVGNFLSNAIKYTSIGGHIEVGTCLIDDACIEIYVEDSGSGFNQQQRKTIFHRFKRLEQHQTIEGVGIGLAVVEELALANDATIDVASEIGKGSRFSITFPIIKAAQTFTPENVITDKTLDRLTTTIVNQQLPDNPLALYKAKPKNSATVLVIEDNDDMRSHIQTVLNDNFNCMTADSGSKGIALALEKVPDVIVCDVMMPEMDGFQVSRIIRNDIRTSHIPLILLTALDEKASRIKGWQENIDVYMTKPFDAVELNIRIQNVLNVRNILNSKVKKSLNEGKEISTLELPKKDRDFFEKMNALIKSKHHESDLSLIEIAQILCVSQRQLQRKVRAIADMSPMDILREYRLKKSAELLRDGYQVTITSDRCGFNSVSYFSQCFKKHYGLSPKQYQKLNAVS